MTHRSKGSDNDFKITEIIMFAERVGKEDGMSEER